MLKKILFCAILALQFAVVAGAAWDLPIPPCSPEDCVAVR